MWGQPKQATSAKMAIIYITLGALLDVWMVVYCIYARRHNFDDNAFLWIYGFFFSGVVLMVIGFALGRIGRSAKQAEVTTVPHTVVTQTALPPPNTVAAVDTARDTADRMAMTPSPAPPAPPVAPAPTTAITDQPPPPARRV